MSKKLEKPEEVEDVEMSDILSSLDVTGVGGSSTGVSGIQKRAIAFGMQGTVIVEAAVVIAEKRRAIELYPKKLLKKATAEQKKRLGEVWVAVVRDTDVKLAAKMTAKQMKDRIGNSKMPVDEWRDQTVTIRGTKVPVGIYSHDGEGGISAPAVKSIDGYGPIFKQKTKRLGQDYGVYKSEEEAALIELKGKFERFRPKK